MNEMPSSLSSRRLHRLLLQHVVHGEVLARRRAGTTADRSCRSQSALFTIRAAFGRAVEVEEPLELRPDAGDVRLDLLGATAAGAPATCRSVADHAGATADERDRRVPEALQARERHHRQQRADVQARRRRIEADIGGDAPGASTLGEAFGGVVEQAAPLNSSKTFVMSTRLLQRAIWRRH